MVHVSKFHNNVTEMVNFNWASNNATNAKDALQDKMLLEIDARFQENVPATKHLTSTLTHVETVHKDNLV